MYLIVVDAGFSSMAISWTVAGALWRCDIHGTVVFWLVVAGFMVTTEWFSRRFYYSELGYCNMYIDTHIFIYIYMYNHIYILYT